MFQRHHSCAHLVKCMKNNNFCAPLRRIVIKKNHINNNKSILFRQFSSKRNNEVEKDEQSQKKGYFAKIRELWKEYGYKAIMCYSTLYFLNVGCFAYALEYDILNLHDIGFDAHDVLEMMGKKYEQLTGRVELQQILQEHPRYGIFAISLFLTDFCEPLRIGATIFLLSRLKTKNKIN